MKFLSQINVNTEYALPIVDGANGQVLTTDGSGAVYWGSVSIGALNLDGLQDVVITSPASGQILRYGIPVGSEDPNPVWHNWTHNFATTSNTVTITGTQTITGSKTFTAATTMSIASGSNVALTITKGGSHEALYINKTSGSGNAVTVVGTLEATTIVKTGGTASQFLKADGSVDTNTYLTSYTETQTLDAVTDLGSTTTNAITVGGLTSTSVTTQLIESGGLLIIDADTSGGLQPDQGDPAVPVLSFDWQGSTQGYIDTDGKITFNGFKTPSGTSSQFLKANGTVDSNVYITSAALSGYATQTWINSNFYNQGQIDDFFYGNEPILGYNKTNWDTAYDWGNHAEIGYLTTYENNYISDVRLTETTLSFTGEGSGFTGDIDLSGLPFAASSHSHTIADVTGLETALNGKVPTTRTITINGTALDLSANRSWTISSADGYISDVRLTESTLSFSGEGSAFSGTVDLSTLPFAPQGSYLTAEADTLATVTGRGNSTTNSITVGGFRLNNTGVISYSGYAGLEYHNTYGTWEGYIGTESGTGNLRYNSRLGIHNWYSNSVFKMSLNSYGLGIGRDSASNEKLAIDLSDGIWGLHIYNAGTAIGGLHANSNVVTLQSDGNRNIEIATGTGNANWNGNTLATRTWVTSQGYLTSYQNNYISDVRLSEYNLEFTGEGSAFTGTIDLSGLPFQPAGSYLTAETDTLASVTGRGASTSSTLTSTAQLGLYVNSGSASYIGMNSTSNWAYVSLLNNGSTTWDIGAYNGGTLEFRPYGSGNNVMYLGLDGSLSINSLNDGKLTLRVPSGDSSEWNYINFVGSNGVRDAYLGTDGGGNPQWWRDDNNVSITLGSSVLINGNTAWHSGNDGSGSGLDADLLDGIDSSRIVYGDGANGRSIGRTNGNANTSDSSNASGFYYGYNVTGMPTADWWNWLTVRGEGWSGSDGYQFQIAGSFWGDDYRIRRMTTGTNHAWVSIIHSGNIASQSVSYATSSGNSVSTDQTNFSALFIEDAAVATKEFVTSQGYITGYTETDPIYVSERNLLQLNKTVHPTLLFSTLADYNKPSGYSTMIQPSSYQNPLPSHGYYHIIARRDTGGGYGALLQSYNSHELYHGNTTQSTSDITWYKIWNSGDFSSTSVTNWNTAYGWGNHADAPYWNVELTDDVSVSASSVRFGGNIRIDGDLEVLGTITETSSIRFKENITTIDPALDKVNQLEAVSYNKIGVDDREIGLIAEDVAELFPEVVTYNEEGQPQGIQYQRLSVILLKAVQELSQEVNELKKKLN